MIVSIDRVAAGEVVDMTDPIRDHLNGNDKKGRSIHDALASLTGLLSESDVHLKATQTGSRFAESGTQGEDGAFERSALVLGDLVSSCGISVSTQSSKSDCVRITGHGRLTGELEIVEVQTRPNLSILPQIIIGPGVKPEILRKHVEGGPRSDG